MNKNIFVAKFKKETANMHIHTLDVLLIDCFFFSFGKYFIAYIRQKKHSTFISCGRLNGKMIRVWICSFQRHLKHIVKPLKLKKTCLTFLSFLLCINLMWLYCKHIFLFSSFQKMYMFMTYNITNFLFEGWNSTNPFGKICVYVCVCVCVCVCVYIYIYIYIWKEHYNNHEVSFRKEQNTNSPKL